MLFTTAYSDKKACNFACSNMMRDARIVSLHKGPKCKIGTVTGSVSPNKLNHIKFNVSKNDKAMVTKLKLKLNFQASNCRAINLRHGSLGDALGNNDVFHCLHNVLTM